MIGETVKLEIRGNIGFITLNRPDEYNSLNFELGDNLIEALEVCRYSKEVKCVVITGEGKAFCSGGDLNMAHGFLNSDPTDAYRQLTKRLNRIIVDIRRLEKPVIASINGAAGGAGLSIALACDLRIASSTAKFKQAYTAIGLVPDGCWALFTPLLTGLSKTNEMLYLDPVISADQALVMGLINKMVAVEELEQATWEWAEQIVQGPGFAYGIAKNLINESVLGLMERQAELERQGIIKAACSQDYLEGLDAFFNKRSAQFMGR